MKNGKQEIQEKGGMNKKKKVYFYPQWQQKTIQGKKVGIESCDMK